MRTRRGDKVVLQDPLPRNTNGTTPAKAKAKPDGRSSTRRASARLAQAGGTPEPSPAGRPTDAFGPSPASRAGKCHMRFTTGGNAPRPTKRIKLISRRSAPAPAFYTNSSQPPAPPRHGRSVDAFLRSYHTSGDEEASWQRVLAAEEEETALRLKIAPYAAEGFSHVPAAANSAAAIDLRRQRSPPRTEKSHHEHVVDHALLFSAAIRADFRTRIGGCRRIARMVAAFWEREAGAEERERKAEEKRVRALAKWTVREVNKKWRLAVQVVRARKRRAEKEELDRQGRQHLGRILEDSVGMLKRQHIVLGRPSTTPEDIELSDVGTGEDDSEYSSDDDGKEGVANSGGVDGREEGSRLSYASSDSDDDASGTAGLLGDGWSRRRSSASGTQSPRWANGMTDSPSIASHSLVSGLSSPVLVEKDPLLASGTLSPPRDVELSPSANGRALSPGHLLPGVDPAGRRPLIEEIPNGVAARERQPELTASNSAHSDIDAPSPPTRLEPANGTLKSPEKRPFVPNEPDRRSYISSVASSSKLDVASPTLANDFVSSDDFESDSDASPASPAAVSDSDQSETHFSRLRQPFLLRGVLRPYQHVGFEWLVGLHENGVNGILADEMGLGKTIQTIALLAHLACEKGDWGPHLVVVPTSVMLNWEIEFKKFLPGFKTLTYFGSPRERKEKRVGWNTPNSFHVCITSYQLVLADQHIFRRKPWKYMILDEAHNIKNFRSQRWQTLIGFNTEHRLLLTGTPLQNNLTDLWSLLYFLMPQGMSRGMIESSGFANQREFQEWFSNPLDKAIEAGRQMDEETRAMVAKLHTVLRPYILRRLKADVEQEMPRKFEHVITCRLSKRQRFLYNDFMSRAKTRESLASGNYLSIINCLMQLRKVCNHPDLFEVRPIVTSFAMPRAVVADYEIRELLVRRRLLAEDDMARVDLNFLNLKIPANEERLGLILAEDVRHLNACDRLLQLSTKGSDSAAPLDTRTMAGFQRHLAGQRALSEREGRAHLAYQNRFRCNRRPVYGAGLLSILRTAGSSCRLQPLGPGNDGARSRSGVLSSMVVSNMDRCERMKPLVDRFGFVTPAAVARDMPELALPGISPERQVELQSDTFDSLHDAAVKLQIAFPDASLLQYDCGKLQELDRLMRRLKEGGHRILIFTQMTKVLDILEIFLNYHGYRYLRLDGATKVEQRQILTERFNRDSRIMAFILSTRSGGLGINLTGADTVLFYDLDWNAAIEAQCQDRAHRIGQTRDVNIYRFVSEHTIEENMLKKANQKRILDSMVIQEGDFTTTALQRLDWRDMLDDGMLGDVKVADMSSGPGSAQDVERAFAMAEDEEDVEAAKVAKGEMNLDATDFSEQAVPTPSAPGGTPTTTARPSPASRPQPEGQTATEDVPAGYEEAREKTPHAVDAVMDEEDEDEGGTVDDYMLKFVEEYWELFV